MTTNNGQNKLNLVRVEVEGFKKVCKVISFILALFFGTSVATTPVEVSITKKAFPLPAEYRQYKTSEQGLRGSIENVTASGGSSLEKYHDAIDYACPDRTPVYACDDGYVINVYPSYYNGSKWRGHSSYGGLIEIRHSDSTTSLYAHLSMTEVKEGDFVKRGNEIGLSGGVRGRRGSGNSTGPHLHFAVYMNIEDIFED